MPLAAIGHSLETALWIFTRYINHFARLSIQKKHRLAFTTEKERHLQIPPARAQRGHLWSRFCQVGVALGSKNVCQSRRCTYHGKNSGPEKTKPVNSWTQTHHKGRKLLGDQQRNAFRRCKLSQHCTKRDAALTRLHTVVVGRRDRSTSYMKREKMFCDVRVIAEKQRKRNMKIPPADQPGTDWNRKSCESHTQSHCESCMWMLCVVSLPRVFIICWVSFGENDRK